MNEPLINQLKVDQVAKAYGKRQILTSVSMSINSGEVIGLLGPNGAGKTTCFYIVVGLVQADSGVITLNEKDITKLPIHARALLGVGYLPQEASIFRKLTVAENVMAILETRIDINRDERQHLVEQLLEDLQISHIRDSLGVALSGGERRRAEIARALAANPQFILLDEPFAGVDPVSVNDIQRIIEHLCSRNIGVLITDHNVRETLGICDRAYILGNGEVIASGGTEEILNNQQVREIYLGDDFKL